MPMMYLLCAQIAVLMPLVNDRVREVMWVETYVRIERFILAKPTAASPANYKKEMGVVKRSIFKGKLMK